MVNGVVSVNPRCKEHTSDEDRAKQSKLAHPAFCGKHHTVSIFFCLVSKIPRLCEAIPSLPQIGFEDHQTEKNVNDPMERHVGRRWMMRGGETWPWAPNKRQLRRGRAALPTHSRESEQGVKPVSSLKNQVGSGTGPGEPL